MVEISILDSVTYRCDLDRIIKIFKDIDFLQDKAFFITGCNGLICSSVVDILIGLNRLYSLNLKLYLATRNKEKTKARFKTEDDAIIFFDYDANKPFDLDKKIDFYIHGASNATPNLFVSNPVETMMSNIFGLKEILDKAKVNGGRVLFVSSSEIYGKLQSKEPILECEQGFIELLDSHSSYGSSKRASETLCESYRQEYNVDYVIVRPGHIYGPTASQNDLRVSSKLMYDVVNGKDIVLKSKGEQIRSYCYCLDAASAILFALFYGVIGNAYNISNPNSIISIADMAKEFAKSANVEVKFDIPTESEKKAFNPMLNSSLNSDKLLNLGWNPVFSREEGFYHSVKIIKELME